jgi:hypothetical protein
MNCDLACHLIDDYLENRLSRYERQCLEAHLASCPDCSEELRQRPVFERTMQRALASAVQNYDLSTEASVRIVQEAQSSLRRAVWTNRAVWTFQVVASVAAIALVVVGLLVLLGRIPVPSHLGPVNLSPVSQWLFSEQHPATLSTVDEPNLESTSSPAVWLSNSDMRLEPFDMEPGEPFTLTLLLHTDMPQPLDTARFTIDVQGPSGYYSFLMAVQGPLPANGVSVLRVTPDLLATTSRERYLISPTEIFGEPGVYRVRVTVFSPVLKPES